MLQVIDLIADPRPELWHDVVKFIESQTEDSLKSNYINLDFSQFISFPCVVKNEKIICFSGLQYDERKWGKKIARCSSRMWVHPDHRQLGLSTLSGGDKFLNTTYCVPVQIAKARELLLDTVFVSREKNPKSFGKYIDLVKTNCDLLFDIKPHRYNVCGNIDLHLESCKQWVAVHHLSTSGADSWRIAMLKYIIAE